MTVVHERPYGLTRAVVEIAADALAATTATDTFTVSGTAPANGSRFSLTSIGGLTGVALNTTYYVVNASGATFKAAATHGGTPITVGTGAPSVHLITEVELQWPNKIAPNIENNELKWEGGDGVEKLPMLLGMSLNIDLDCVPTSAHQVIFDKSTVTNVPGGFTNGVGFGGGADKSGAACGFYIEGYEVKDQDGVRSTTPRRRWFPVGTLTLRQPGGQSTGGKDDVWGYTFTAKRTTTDILGSALSGVSSDGEFFVNLA